MIDIWKYNYVDNICLTTLDGEVYIGNVINIWDTEEMEDEDENELVLELENGEIRGFKQSEILKLRKM